MFKSLVLENFRALGRRQEVKLAPIALIFGANSAGKSSILDSLLLLKQTLGQSETTDSVLLPKGPLVDLGSFRDIVYGHDVKRTFEIAPLLSSSDVPWPPERPTGSRREGIDSVSIAAGLGFRFSLDEPTRIVQLESVQQYWGSHSKPLFTVSTTREEVSASDADAYIVNRRRPSSENVGRPAQELIGRIHILDLQNPFWSSAYDRTAKFRAELAGRLGAFLNTTEDRAILQYPDREILYGLDRISESPGDPRSGMRSRIPAMRQVATRLADRLTSYNLEKYVEDIRSFSSTVRLQFLNFCPIFSNHSAHASGDSGLRRSLSRQMADEGLDLGELVEAYAQQLRRHLGRMLYLGPLREYPERHYIFSGNVASEVGKTGSLLPDMLYGDRELVRRLDSYLKKFDIGYSIDVFNPELPGLEGVFSLQLRDTKTETQVSVRDVGFGLSQVLPVIVQATLSRNRTILIEQPEIHLHPKLQADLGTLFAECSAPPNQNQFIIETHSEHIILRLQRLIRLKELPPESVSVIYVTKGREGSECHWIRLDQSGGFLDPWPEGFFEEGFKEMFANS